MSKEQDDADAADCEVGLAEHLEKEHPEHDTPHNRASFRAGFHKALALMRSREAAKPKQKSPRG